jgi:phospho-N-acetylmuramoyl-pentapeptide-transferase
VDAKFSVQRGLILSGSMLLLTLGTFLGTAALIFDRIAGRISLTVDSLFLPLLVCSILTAAIGYWAVPLLQRLKARQFIREDGPQSHLKKGGTPTMGGVFIVPVAVTVAIAWSGFAGPVMVVSILTLAYGLIGWLDDWQILSKRSNKGISPRLKLGLQIGFGILFCLLTMFSGYADRLTTLALPFGIWLPIGVLIWPLAVFVLTAESNATNLTDGLDGLAAGTGAIVALGLGVLITPDHPDLALFCTAISGSYLGFLVHNRNPARVFMGDTGSLALGGALASVAIMTNTLWALFIMGGLFFWESISVILQVAYYKATKNEEGVGKRLFKMAPFHHHLELSGWSETQVVKLFYGMTAILVLCCLRLY